MLQILVFENNISLLLSFWCFSAMLNLAEYFSVPHLNPSMLEFDVLVLKKQPTFVLDFPSCRKFSWFMPLV